MLHCSIFVENYVNIFEEQRKEELDQSSTSNSSCIQKDFHLVESIPDDAFEPFTRMTGCPAYHPRMMMKIILCVYTQSVFSGRKIEGLLQDSLRMMWLAQGNEPSYSTINRLRVHTAVTLILKQAFVTFRYMSKRTD